MPDPLRDAIEEEVASFFREGATTWEFGDLADAIAKRLHSDYLVEPIAPQVKAVLDAHPIFTQEMEVAVLDTIGGRPCQRCGHLHNVHMNPHTQQACACWGGNAGDCKCDGWVNIDPLLSTETDAYAVWAEPLRVGTDDEGYARYRQNRAGVLPPAEWWKAVPCGHPQSPVAWLMPDGVYACHCAQDLTGEDGDLDLHPDGDVAQCPGCGCHVLLLVPD